MYCVCVLPCARARVCVCVCNAIICTYVCMTICITGVLCRPNNWHWKKRKKTRQQNLCVFVANIGYKFYIRLYLPPFGGYIPKCSLWFIELWQRIVKNSHLKCIRVYFKAESEGKFLFSLHIYIHCCVTVRNIQRMAVANQFTKFYMVRLIIEHHAWFSVLRDKSNKCRINK